MDTSNVLDSNAVTDIATRPSLTRGHYLVHWLQTENTTLDTL